jgi:hypothetical protein
VNYDGTVTVDEIIYASKFIGGGPCSNEGIDPEPTPFALDCTYDCYGYGKPGDFELERVRSDLQTGIPSCLRADRDGVEGLGLMDAMAVIQDVLHGCRTADAPMCMGARVPVELRDAVDEWPAGSCE